MDSMEIKIEAMAHEYSRQPGRYLAASYEAFIAGAEAVLELKREKL